MSGAAGLVEPARDLLALTAELVDIPSVSHNETAMADRIERLLRGAAHLEVKRLGDNVLARTSLDLPMRLVLAGHLDTVPPNGNERATITGDVCHGIGAADMKGGLAVMAEVALQAVSPAVDFTFIAYVCEEVDQSYSGLGQIEAEMPEWLAGDAAVLGEPTGSVVEAGCQGVLNAEVEMRGERAHTARPWTGVNAIQRLAPLLAVVAGYEARCPVLDGCKFREALQAVAVAGGVANNVVPDSARVKLNHRFAPDRSADDAFAAVLELVSPVLDPVRGDSVRLVDAALSAAPRLDHALLARLVESSGTAPRAKLGWTDVSFFSARGMPAANYGPGEPSLAHSAGERVDRDDLLRSYSTLLRLVRTGLR
ncbi:MAG: succinyl-diaminopimelate desuccinylase [Acidimicrobiales bacterium]